MKNLLTILCITFSLLFISCSKDLVTNSPQSIQDPGNMLLKFNKAETPNNVASITASLMRQGYTTISGSLSFVTDTSAQLTLQNITAGLWHLRIEAKDNSNAVVYAGETDVTIVAGVITQVLLTLQSTGTLIGGIYILVNWGVNISPWIDYNTNPIFKGTGQTFDQNGVTRPVVLIEGNSFKMWYLNCGVGNVGTIGYAESNDGITWVRPVSQPVLNCGLAGFWDAASITPGPVIKVGGTYRMYYSGRAQMSGLTSIGLATSIDGINWVKNPNPVLVSKENWEGSIDAGDIVKINSTYYMYYSGINGGIYKIGIATSPDGITWTRLFITPILTGDEAWEGNGVLTPTIIYNNNKYVMAYLNGVDYPDAFGLATSIDGINWVKDSNNPFFTAKSTYNKWISCILYPCIRKYNNELRVYYSGFDVSANKRYIALVKSIQ